MPSCRAMSKVCRAAAKPALLQMSRSASMSVAAAVRQPQVRNFGVAAPGGVYGEDLRMQAMFPAMAQPPEAPRPPAPAVAEAEDALVFEDPLAAFKVKSTLELLRTYFIFQMCRIGPIVRHCDALYSLGVKYCGPGLTHGALRYTFFNHFCAGETVKDIIPRMAKLRKLGVGGILDYAAEAKDAVIEQKGEHLASKKDLKSSVGKEVVGAPLSSRYYDYKGEALCDANTEIFLDAIRGVRDAVPDGFAAIKLTGLGNPMLLERMSTCLLELHRLFNMLGNDYQTSKASYFQIDRSCELDFADFSNGWMRFFRPRTSAELRAKFDAIDTSGGGTITFEEWAKSMKLSEINALIRQCVDKGPLYHAALDQEEVELYQNLIARTVKIMDYAKELGVRVMVDAEWLSIQPAIDHIVHHLQRRYNKEAVPIVFQTYQTYLQGMEESVRRDLERADAEGWKFGCKVVRGAYMVSEREKAAAQGRPSPICESYEATEKNFHACIDAVLSHNAGVAGAPNAEMLVASHSQGSIEHTVRRMEELGKDRRQVYFGQLLGMADHLTFTLAAHGYKAYKYVPYGPIDEVVPYLIRRTQENSALLGSAGVHAERKMVSREVRRRLLGF